MDLVSFSLLYLYLHPWPITLISQAAETVPESPPGTQQHLYSAFHIQMSLEFCSLPPTQNITNSSYTETGTSVRVWRSPLTWKESKHGSKKEEEKTIYYTSQFRYRGPRENCTGPWWWWPHTTPPPFPSQRVWRSAWAAAGGGASRSGPVGSQVWRAQLQRKHSTVAL